MAFHIVTSRCFLVCERVTSVLIQETVREEQPSFKPLFPVTKRKIKSKKLKPQKTKPRAHSLKDTEYTITIAYYPVGQGHTPQNLSGDPTEYTLSFTVLGKNSAFTLYAEIVKEVQEQHPNEGYLDKLVSKLLESDEFKMTDPKAINER